MLVQLSSSPFVVFKWLHACIDDPSLFNMILTTGAMFIHIALHTCLYLSLMREISTCWHVLFYSIKGEKALPVNLITGCKVIRGLSMVINKVKWALSTLNFLLQILFLSFKKTRLSYGYSFTFQYLLSVYILVITMTPLTTLYIVFQEYCLVAIVLLRWF